MPSHSLQHRRMAVSASAVSLTSEGLQTPHGGSLVDLMTDDSRKASLVSSTTHSVDLTDRQACDVELLIVGFIVLRGCWLVDGRSDLLGGSRLWRDS